jgi:hypothetical protein
MTGPITKCCYLVAISFKYLVKTARRLHGGETTTTPLKMVLFEALPACGEIRWSREIILLLPKNPNPPTFIARPRKDPELKWEERSRFMVLYKQATL